MTSYSNTSQFTYPNLEDINAFLRNWEPNILVLSRLLWSQFQNIALHVLLWRKLIISQQKPGQWVLEKHFLEKCSDFFSWKFGTMGSEIQKPAMKNISEYQQGEEFF